MTMFSSGLFDTRTRSLRPTIAMRHMSDMLESTWKLKKYFFLLREIIAKSWEYNHLGCVFPWSVWPDQASSLKESANLSWSNFRHLRDLSPARGRSKLNERKQKGCRPCWSAIILTNNVTTTPTIHPDNKNTIKSDHKSQWKVRQWVANKWQVKKSKFTH